MWEYSNNGYSENCEDYSNSRIGVPLIPVVISYITWSTRPTSYSTTPSVFLLSIATQGHTVPPEWLHIHIRSYAPSPDSYSFNTHYKLPISIHYSLPFNPRILQYSIAQHILTTISSNLAPGGCLKNGCILRIFWTTEIHVFTP